MNVDALLLHVFEVAKNNGGHLTLREAASCCEQHFQRLQDDNKSNNNKDNISSNDININSKINNDRDIERENRLKSLLKFSKKLKLNGNLIFTNDRSPDGLSKYPVKNFSGRKLVRRKSLPDIGPDSEIVRIINNDLKFKPEKSNSITKMWDKTSTPTSPIVSSKENKEKLISKCPGCSEAEGENVQLLKVNDHHRGHKFNQNNLNAKSQNSSPFLVSEISTSSSAMHRSHSLDDCKNIDEIPKRQNKTATDSFRYPPSYLATPCAYNYFSGISSCAGNFSGWTDTDMFSGKYKTADRLATIMKNFETDLQLVTDRYLKLMRSELDNMLVDMHRPVNRNLGQGSVFHVDKKWGIIDLGNHDHVFFDMSIMLGTVDDLKNHFQVGEVLGFEAVKAQKSSRAKWRAIRVWKVDSPKDFPRHDNAQSSQYLSCFPIEVFLKQKPSNPIEKPLFRIGENNSKGNSPDSSPASFKGKKKQTNPLQSTFSSSCYQALGSYPKLAWDGQHSKLGKSQSTAALSSNPLFLKPSHPLNCEEIRLIPKSFLSPPEIKKASNILPTLNPKSLIDPHKSTKLNTSEAVSGVAGDMQRVNSKQQLRDSGTDSGHNSPDESTMLKNDGCISAQTNTTIIKRTGSIDAFCQTEEVEN